MRVWFKPNCYGLNRRFDVIEWRETDGASSRRWQTMTRLRMVPCTEWASLFSHAGSASPQDRGIWHSSAVLGQLSARVLAACPILSAKRRICRQCAIGQAQETNWAVDMGQRRSGWGVRRHRGQADPSPALGSHAPKICWNRDHMGYGQWRVPQPICSRCEGQAPLPNHMQVH